MNYTWRAVYSRFCVQSLANIGLWWGARLTCMMYQGISFLFFHCVCGQQAFGHSSKDIIYRYRFICWLVVYRHIVMDSSHNCTVGCIKVVETSGNK